jgi:hypothetical protein
VRPGMGVLASGMEAGWRRKRSVSVHAPGAGTADANKKLRRVGEWRLVGIRRATFDRSNNDRLVLLIKLIQNAPIPNPAAKRAVEVLEEFNVALERVFTHFRKRVVDIAQLRNRKSSELPLGATSDRQAPFHASIL